MQSGPRSPSSTAWAPSSVRVDDDGRGVPDVAALDEGHGIRGMRERAASLGGDLRIEPSPLGGVRVTATFPTGAIP